MTREAAGWPISSPHDAVPRVTTVRLCPLFARRLANSLAISAADRIARKILVAGGRNFLHTNHRAGNVSFRDSDISGISVTR